MNLGKKKDLARRTLGVGKERIMFSESRLEDIKEAITKQDIKQLHEEGAIMIKEKKGRKKIISRKRRRNKGKIKRKPKKRKQEYVSLVRKLRKYLAEIEKQGKISKEDKKELRKKIRNKIFKNHAQLKSHIQELKKS